jgi:CheY-like chemotaxis protein
MKNKIYPSHPVLIVDDEKNSLLSTNVALSSSGINNIVTCQDSCKVEGLLSQNQFSVIILDMIMPGISGWDLCPIIIRKYPDLPVIILTGVDEVASTVKCMKTGVFDYLSKPVSLSRLTETTKHAIEFAGLKRENRMLKEYLLSDNEENTDTIKLKNTSKNQVFELLKKTRLEYKSFFKNIPIPVFISNVKTNTIEHCNTAFAEFMGFRDCREVLENKESLMDYCNLKEKNSLLKHLKTSGIIQNLEMTGRKRDGSEFCILLNCKLQKDTQCTECSFIDITDQKLLEEQLRQSQKMEALGCLSGGIAHDFNNLLTAIIGYSDLIISKSSLDKSVYCQVEEIKKAGKRAASLTQQLLAFSRKQVLQAKEIDLNKLVPNIDRMLRRVIGEDIALTTKLAPDLGKIKAEPGQIEQVIMNLAVNARDAMPKGGNLTIETGNVHIDKDITRHSIQVIPGPHVMLAMSDTGVGMDKKTKAHMFDPFFTTKKIDKGTGLGLSTVYGIVEQSGGIIQVDSEPGKGTTFEVYFPRIADDKMESEQFGEFFSPRRGKETVLLVEDEGALKALLSTVLEGYGYRVLEAENGYKAIKISDRTEKIDLMITDIVMPNVSGPELAKDILKRHPKTKVLYISGYTDDKLSEHGLHGECIHFLQKPFAPENLAQKVREVLDN